MEGLSTFIFVANGKKSQFKLLWDVEERREKITYFLDAKVLSWQGRGEVPGEDSHPHRCISLILNGK